MKELTRSILMFALLGFCVAGVTAQDKGSEASVKYDKKNDVTTVRLKPFKISRLIGQKQAQANVPSHQTDIEISYSFSGQQMTKPVETVAVKFKISSGSYTFLRPQTVMAVLDAETPQGRAFALGDSTYKSDPPIANSLYAETLVVDAPVDAINKIAKANSLQLYLGPVAYAITPKQLDAIKGLAENLRPPAASSTKK